MMYLDLFLGFLKVGCFAFGGAYGAIPLIQDVVMSYGWISDEMFAYFVAVSESTPGPIMVNLATFIGKQVGGPLGAAIATITVVLPAFVIILLVMVLFKKAMERKWFQNILKGLQPTIIGIIIATGLMMCLETIANVPNEFNIDYKDFILRNETIRHDVCIIPCVSLFVITFRYKNTLRHTHTLLTYST